MASRVRCIAICCLALIVLVGLALLSSWLATRPKDLVYTLENASLKNFNLSNNRHLNATFDFILGVLNPSTRASVVYDFMEYAVSFKDKTLAFNRTKGFSQPHRKKTRVESSLMVKNLVLSPLTYEDLKREESSGEIKVGFRFVSKIRFKAGIWKWKRPTQTIWCPLVSLPLPLFKVVKSAANVQCV